MKTIWNGIWKENPTFVLLLGLCPVLAMTKRVEDAYLMGICVLLVLTFSNVIVSLLRGIVPKSVSVPVYILIIGTLVTILEILLQAFIPKLYQVLGIYLPLIVVNCIVLGRAISVASRNRVGKSFLDGLGVGLGFTGAMVLIALIREILGNNTLTLMDSISSVTGYRAVYRVFSETVYFPVRLLQEPAGAFLVLGVMMALINWMKNRGGKKDESR